jgi:arylsulfatase A-like enzyme
MVFTNFYSGGPVCSPTRASILTGKSPARIGITTFLITPDQDAAYVTHELALDEFTLAEAFKKNGYRTGMFGKWHLGYELRHWASQQGFDVAIGGTTSRNAWRLAYPEREPPIDQLEVRYFSPHHLTHMKDGPPGKYLTDRLVNETIKFIEQSGDQLFFAYLAFHTVHTPLEAKPETIAKYAEKFRQSGLVGKNVPKNGSREFQNLPAYAAMVEHMDENVGRLLKALDKAGLRDNTIVVFTSDNGGVSKVTSNAPLRGAKHNLYEGGIRVPTVIRYPPKIQAGTRSDAPLISHDFYPTLLDLAGLPLETEQHVDGKSFRELAMGQKSASPHEALFWHYPHNRFEASVRWNNLKLIYEYRTGSAELYDLNIDIGEHNNLAATKPESVARMKKMLRGWLKDTQAKFPDEDIVMP